MDFFKKTDRSLSRLLILGISLFFVVYEVLRAARVPFTPDEAGTFRKFVSTNVLAVFSFGSANNHFLNTVLTKFFYGLAGSSELVLRLPNLLAYVIYLVSAFLLLERCVKNRILVVCGFLLLNVNPYVLDFFSLSRGYGLSLGFLMAGLYFFFSFLEETASRDPRGLRHLYLSLAALSLAVLSNFVLLNAYLSLVIFSFIVLAILNSRERFGRPAAQPPFVKRSRRRILPALLILAAVLFNLSVVSQDFGLAGRFFEPVAVKITGLDDKDKAQMKVLRIDSQNLEGELPNTDDLWKMEDTIYFKAIKFRCPPGLLSKIKRIEIRIGPQKFSYDAVDIKRFQVYDVEGYAVFMAKKAVSLKRSMIPAFRAMINWRGDSIFLEALPWRILLVTGIAALVIGLIYGLGRLLGRWRILTVEQFRPLALTTILLGLFTGYPLAILKRSGELYYGGQNGFIRDTVFSLIHNSFYGASYFPWQEQAAGLFILLSILCFLIVLFVHYWKNALSSSLPGFSVLSLLVFVSVLTITERFLFGNPYLLGRTGLFLIPLYTLLLIFLAQYAGRLKRRLGVVATALLVIITFLTAYHFCQTANTALTVDWEREAIILGRLARSTDVLDTPTFYGYMK
jgi:hypothetical protein